MSKVFIRTFQSFLTACFVIITVVSMQGCSTTSVKNYQLGDISKRYCGSTSQEFRAIIKATLTKKGFDIGVDYCAAHGLVDALSGG